MQEENKVKKGFLKNMKAELKKVIWPTGKQVFNNTVATIAFVLMISLILVVLNFVFNFAKTQLDKRIFNIEDNSAVLTVTSGDTTSGETVETTSGDATSGELTETTSKEEVDVVPENTTEVAETTETTEITNSEETAVTE